MECIFCKIASKVIPAQIIFENENILAFNDIKPAAPVHILIIPKKHIESIKDISSDDKDIIAGMFTAISEIADIKNLSDEGYRLIINNGKAAGQEVFHLHIHLLGGKKKLGPMLSS
jgi:histidine triad (HIT) family protein